MKVEKVAFTALLVLGIGLLGVSLLADVVGLTDDSEFGSKQQLGAMVGVLMAGTGASLLRRFTQA